MAEPLAALVEEYYRRRALGEALGPDAFRERAGPRFDEFKKLVEADPTSVAPPAVPPTFPFAFGAYLVLNEIGRGGQGVVYEALQRATGRRVALKVLRLWHLGDERLLARFRREAQLCSRIRHENIVEIFDAEDVCGRPYFAMELVEGHSLDALVKDQDAPPPRELALAIADVADAVHRLHEAGVIHRDLKPSNIVFRPDGRPVLTDFGVAQDLEASQLTKTGDALGTPAFMSPEQLLGRRDAIDARTDVYGLGATLYFGLTGKTIAPHQDRAAMVRAILATKPPSARAQNRAVPRAIARVTRRAIAKRRANRPPTAAALRDELRAAAAARPLTAWKVGVPLAVGVAVTGLAWPTRDAPPPRVAFAELRTGPPPGVLRSGVAADPALPRGDVTAADLDAVFIRVDDTIDGRLEFRVDGDTLSSEPFDPDNLWTRVPVPDAVRAAARPGATVEWGLVSKEGREYVARCRVVAGGTPPGDALERAQRLLDGGRAYAAYRLVRELETGPERTRLAIERAALERMGVTEWRYVWEPLLRRIAAAE